MDFRFSRGSSAVLWAAEGSGGAGAEPVPPARARVRPGAFNRKVLAALEEARQVARAAQAPEYASVWAAWGIAASSGAALAQKVAECDELLQRAVNARGDSKAGTAGKSEAKTRIVAAVRRVQSGARVRAEEMPPDEREAELQKYFVGAPLDKNDSELGAIAQAILLLLASQPLPGVGPAQIAELQAALAAFQEAGDDQADHGDSSEGLRAQAQKLLDEEISPLRRKLQLAIDGEFPYTDLDHRAARKEFDLPPARPFS